MAEELNWRPEAWEIVEAERLLTGEPRFLTRLKMVRELKAQPNAPLQAIAHHCNTRISVVRGFLQRWQAYGLESIVAFGPNKVLSKNQLLKLKASFNRKRFPSLEEVSKELKSKFGLILSRQTIRSYCEKCGLERRKTKVRTAIKLHKTWTEDNITRIATENRGLKGRLIAILRACEQPTLSLRQIAARSKPALVAESTLRADLRAIKPTTTLGGFVERRKRLPLLDRLNLRTVFYAWATRLRTTKGTGPTASEVIAHLKAEHAVKITVRSAYNCLDEWKRHARIGNRKYCRREKLIPSEGLAARSIH